MTTVWSSEVIYSRRSIAEAAAGGDRKTGTASDWGTDRGQTSYSNFSAVSWYLRLLVSTFQATTRYPMPF